VIPSEYGTHSEPLFCCRRRYWCRGSESRLISSPLLEVEGDATAIEPVSEQLEEDRAVVISGLCKTFNTKEGPKKAVDHLNLSMYKNQITCLLGHNGAGKTTTISMLTGLIPSTAGDATVFNRSIVDDIQACRELTGVCPQYDILFDKLTVMEHLELYVWGRALAGLFGSLIYLWRCDIAHVYASCNFPMRGAAVWSGLAV